MATSSRVGAACSSSRKSSGTIKPMSGCPPKSTRTRRPTQDASSLDACAVADGAAARDSPPGARGSA